MATDPVSTHLEKPGTQRYQIDREKLWTPQHSSGTVVSSGPKIRHRVSSFTGSDRVIPTDYSIARSSMGGYSITQNYTKDGYKVLPGGVTKQYYTKYRQEGADSNRWRTHHESDPFGVFTMHLNEYQQFMSIPSKYKVPIHNKLLGKIDDQSIDINTLKAELMGTVKHAVGVVVPLVNFGKSIISGRYSKAVKEFGIPKKQWNKFERFLKSDVKSASHSVAGRIASRWAEFNFAIKPSIKDVRDLMALYKDPNRFLGSVKLRASTSTKIHDEHVYPASSYPDWVFSDRKELNGWIKAVAVYTVSDPEIVSAKALGIHNESAAFYNAAPFSWMLDYVVNIGEFLSMITATDGLKFHHGYTSAHFTVQSHVNRTYGKYGPDKEFRTQLHTSAAFYDGYRREVMNTFPRPLVQFVLPDLTLRQASLAASVAYLLTQSATNVGHH